MLLKQAAASTQSNPDVQPFAVDGLFVDVGVFKCLLPVEEPEVLRMKPSQVYEKLRIIARQRYGVTLPESQKELKCLSSQNNKLALMRDVCLKLGVKLLSTQNKEFHLENEATTSRQQAQPTGAGNKKRATQQP